MEVHERIHASCRALFAPQQVAELRILQIPGRNNYSYNAAGWYDDFKELARVAASYEQRNPSGIYVTINPLHRACLARSNNQIVDRIKDTSSDRDITARHWLPIDIDPVRPSGVSASTDELQQAKALSEQIAAYLTAEYGFPAGLRAHSGNGVHLLYRIALPNDDASRDLIKTCLEALATRFDTEQVKVDRTLYNASRILKLWGTVTRKGQHVAERPHRRSTLWTPVPFNALSPVDRDALQHLAGTTSVSTAGKNGSRKASPPQRKGVAGASDTPFLFDLDAFIARHNIAVVREEPFDGTGRRYILAHCVFDHSHVRTSACLGRAPSGAIFYKCQHESCQGKDWPAVRALFEPAAAARVERAAPDEDEDSPWKLAQAFIDEQFTADDLGRVTLRRHRETFYAYNMRTHIYESLSRDHMRVQLTRWLGDAGRPHSTRAVADVLNAVCALVTVPEALEMPFRTAINLETKCATGDPQRYNWITLQNGILDVGGAMDGKALRDCLMNHTTEWLSTTALPFDFPITELDAACDLWQSFLDEVFEGDQNRQYVLQEMFGYCFWPGTKLEKFFILHGAGRNGKSTVLEILQMLLGDANVTSLSLVQLADQTMRYQLYQKMANICGDLPEIEKVEEGLVKNICTGEAIVSNRKYKDAIRFRPRCKLIFSTNTLPRFYDTTMGIWRRLCIIPFDYMVPQDQVDIHLKDKLAEELPGILLWALQGAIRLVEQGGFTASEKCDRANREHRMWCYPIYTFLDECTEQGGSVNVRELWTLYRNWCDHCGLSKPKPLHTFIKDAIGFYPQVQFPRVKTSMAAQVTLHGVQIKNGLPFGRVTGPMDSYWTS